MVGQVQNMDDDLYKAARGNGVPVPPEINFHSRTSGDRNNALHVAAQYGNHGFITQALSQLNEHYYLHLCQRNSKGETPLHQALQFGHLETIQVLLNAHFNQAHGIDVYHREICWRERDDQGDTPLHKALKHGREETAMALLDSELSLRVGDFVNCSLASVVNDENESLAYLATENFCIKFLIKILTEYHLNDVSLKGYKGQTVLHAARSLPNEVMLWLIQTVGTCVLKEQDELGKTVLHYVVEENRYPMVEELLKADSSLAFLCDSNGFTPLHIAFKEGLFPMVQIILEKSPQSVEIRDKNGGTPLHCAKLDRVFLQKCRTSIDVSIMKLLVDGVDNDGNTPLHVALINSKQDAAYQLLLLNGYNRRLKNKERHSPWDLCNSNDYISQKSLVHFKLSILEVEGELERPEVRDYREAYNSIVKSIVHYSPLEDDNDCEKLLDKIGVGAALLLPLNFSAAFNIPGGYDGTTGKPILRDKSDFRTYNISNMVSFFATVTVLILVTCTYAVLSRPNRRWFALLTVNLLRLAILATVFAYTSGLFAIGVIIDEGRYKLTLPHLLLLLGAGIMAALFTLNCRFINIWIKEKGPLFKDLFSNSEPGFRYKARRNGSYLVRDLELRSKPNTPEPMAKSILTRDMC